ncbi:MAG: tRNA (adenosine(37)-N6)-threonylcarbamoyltransferase complex transferase subunit TsaD [Candidatus Omnitrophica bacterium]|nr:tRNA (adenosine(37)-N6)-threonylcarbamoyltransferase complex transferase subunit TsaD [Candidatus Omnitrophota bacterium]
MITLGIETSCDETAAALVKGGREVLASVVFSSLEEHKEFGGVVPEIASRSHVEAVLKCLDLCLKKAKIHLRDIGLIAVTQGPGLMGSLLVGLSAAKALALALGKPLVGVDHVVAHVYAGFLTDEKLSFPCLGFVVSGGHTVLARMDSPSRFKALGATVDDAAGEAFDKVAKILGLGYPGGPEVDRLARGVRSTRFFFKRPILSRESLNFSFSGIKTAVLYEVRKLRSEQERRKAAKEICAAFQESVTEVLTEKSIQAAKSQNLKAIVVGGGVSANSRLREKLWARSRKEGIRVVFPPLPLCRDNAVMIAGLGRALYAEGKRDTLEMGSYSDFEEFLRSANAGN